MKEKRVGARSLKDIKPEILDLLNRGKLESVNLTEWLAVNQITLLENFLQESDRIHYYKPIVSEINNLKKQSTNTINETIGCTLIKLIKEHKDKDLINIMSKHLSDTVRCWASYIIGYNPDLTLDDKFEQIQVFAADNHFGVREISWLAMRKEMIDNIEYAIQILSEWTSSDDENIRRFASEATRPRGVWAAHIEKLKQNPELALSILEPLKSDSSKYVRDSVGNWLNDASKTQPEFVIDLCNKWKMESPTKETDYILKKALRSIK